MLRRICWRQSGKAHSKQTPIIIDQALACLDQVSLWVDDFQNGGLLPAQAGDDGRALAERLRSFLPGAQSQKTMTLANSVPSPREATLPIWVSRLMAAEGDAMAARVQGRRRSSALLLMSRVQVVSLMAMTPCN